jgi:hypothetical protein
VWSLTWNDVEQFHRAVTAESPTVPPDRVLMTPAARIAAKQIHHHRGGAIEVDVIELNPMALLLDFLVRPNLREWQRVVLSAIGGMATAAGTAPLDAAGLARQLDAAQGAEWTEPADPDGPVVALGARALTPGQLPLALFLADPADANAERWTALAVLDDTPDALSTAEHRARWSDWLPWSNLLQFLGGTESERAGIVAGASQRHALEWDDMWLRHRATPTAPSTAPSGGSPDDSVGSTVELTAEQLEELSLFVDDAAAELARHALERGAPMFVGGHEVEGQPVEAAWPDRRVAVLAADAPAPSGWSARPAADWTLDELLAALEVDE